MKVNHGLALEVALPDFFDEEDEVDVFDDFELELFFDPVEEWLLPAVDGGEGAGSALLAFFASLAARYLIVRFTSSAT